MSSRLASIASGVVATLALAYHFSPGAVHGGPDVLWHIVHDVCIPAASAGGDVKPCALVDRHGRVAFLKDRRGKLQYLAIPTDRVTGIESPRVLAPDAPNYWQAAWSARGFVERQLGHVLPFDALGLAVNSRYGRSQNQLHIHLDCIRGEVAQEMKRNERSFGPSWSGPYQILGHPYRAMRMTSPSEASPFRLLAASLPKEEKMDGHTLALLPHRFSDGSEGFVLLDGKADLATGNFGSSEELLDHDCTDVAANR